MFIAGLLLLIPAVAAIGYLLFLAIARLWGVAHREVPAAATAHRVAIVIPAHDESAGLASVIRSCLAVDYPPTQRHVIVIADNCTDDTAEVARATGAECWERTAPDQRGKGQALAWAFERLASLPYDAYLILDADCHLAMDALRLVDGSLQQGHEVLQLNHRVTNPDATAISYVAAVGRTLEYELGYAPKSRLGLAVLLVGTGMVFHRHLFETIPWNATGRAEDTEYTLELARHGRAVRFLANAYIEWRCVETFEELAVQRQRWASGNLELGRNQIGSIFVAGVRQRSVLLLDLAWTVALQSRPLLLCHAVVTAGCWGIGTWYAPRLATIAVASVSVAVLLMWFVYFALGIGWLGMSARRLRLAVGAPRVVWQLVRIAWQTITGSPASTWQRTPRPADVNRKPNAGD